jgi:four helix bundle protein
MGLVKSAKVKSRKVTESMTFAEKFEDLEIWKEARRLNKIAYCSIETCRDLSFKDQIRRAALSVMNNISEGFERRTPKDFAHFLDLAKGSAGEVRSMTYAAEDLRILSNDTASELRMGYETLSKRIAAFQKHLRSK